MSIYIVGMGMGSPGTLTAEALDAIEHSEVVIGADRLLSALPEICSAEKHTAVAAADIARHIENNAGKTICILMSGDTGFYSGTKSLLEKLDPANVTVLPGLSSVQFFAARLKRPWQDWKLVSAHGKIIDAAGIVRENGETFFLTGGDMDVQLICRELVSSGLGSLAVTIGENLGGNKEHIKISTAEALAQSKHDGLAVMLVDNPHPGRRVSCGFPDEAFTRSKTPMTKSEVRSVILSKLKLKDTDIVYDVGAGTGSVSVETALLVHKGQVFSFERVPDGLKLIEENTHKFGVSNLTIVSGDAPASFPGLPHPDAAFIGGSGGNLKEIIYKLLCINPRIRLVISAVALETLSEASGLLSKLPVCSTEIVQISVSRARRLGDYNMMTASNPIFILSAEGCPDNN